MLWFVNNFEAVNLADRFEYPARIADLVALFPAVTCFTKEFCLEVKPFFIKYIITVHG